MVDEGRANAGDPGTLSPKIEIMARALIDLFGDRALEVSERQAASGESVATSATWQQIAEQIRRLRA
jgi:hypothetical protein